MRCTKVLIPLITGFAMIGLSVEALAAPDEEAKEAPRRHRTSKTLISMEEPRGESKSWLEQHVSVRKGVGLVYRYQVKRDGDRKAVLSVGGPVLKRKRFGLLFEVAF